MSNLPKCVDNVVEVVRMVVRVEVGGHQRGRVRLVEGGGGEAQAGVGRAHRDLLEGRGGGEGGGEGVEVFAHQNWLLAQSCLSLSLAL